MTRIAAALILLISVAAGAAAALEQDFFGGRREPMPEPGAANVPYDGKLTFVRLRYTMGFSGRRGWEPPWAHDYPTSDTHVMKILNELTLARPRMDGSNILTLDDPELFKYPIAYLSEPGFWSMDEDEVKGLRDYLSKGGFIMFDDFRGRDWNNLQDQMRLAFPQGQWVELDGSHPIFHSFFEINDPHTMTPPYGGLPPAFYAMFENNDRNGRVMAMANVNNDLGEYWEFSDTGYAPVDLSNEAYKFGVNYFIYAMTH
jgi:Domain of unknown function (DUF4159)